MIFSKCHINKLNLAYHIVCNKSHHRDRGFIYWRLLSTDPAAAKDVVLAEKPLIAEETDLLEPTLLDELICHIASLASVYHKPPSAFVEGKVGLKRMLPARGADTDSDTEVAGATIIPEPGSLIGDLLDMDLHPRETEGSADAGPAPDLLGGEPCTNDPFHET